MYHIKVGLSMFGVVSVNVSYPGGLIHGWGGLCEPYY